MPRQDLVDDEAADRHDRFTIGAVDYAHLPISPDAELACVSCGFYLGADGEDRFAVLLRGRGLTFKLVISVNFSASIT